MANRAKREDDPQFDPEPIVRLYTLFKPCEWLLTELDPKNPDVVLALCDLGAGSPEYGEISLSDLAALTVGLGIPLVERDDEFKAEKTISQYTSSLRASEIAVRRPHP